MEKIVQAKAQSGIVNYHTELISGKHTFFADEPEDLGGSNSGPTPETILCMSLAACTTITLRMYAQRKNYPTGTISVSVDLHKPHEGEPYFIRIIRTESAVEPAMRERLLQVANKCPVHKLLAANKIETKWHAE